MRQIEARFARAGRDLFEQARSFLSPKEPQTPGPTIRDKYTTYPEYDAITGDNAFGLAMSLMQDARRYIIPTVLYGKPITKDELNVKRAEALSFLEAERVRLEEEQINPQAKPSQNRADRALQNYMYIRNLCLSSQVKEIFARTGRRMKLSYDENLLARATGIVHHEILATSNGIVLIRHDETGLLPEPAPAEYILNDPKVEKEFSDLTPLVALSKFEKEVKRARATAK